MAQRAARYLAARRNIADEFDLPRVRRLVRVELLESSLDIVNHWAQRDNPHEAGPAIRVKIPNRRSDLIVLESGDVFHQKVYEPRIALQRLEQLQCAIARLHLGGRRRRGSGRLRLRETKLGGDVFRQGAGKQNREETA